MLGGRRVADDEKGTDHGILPSAHAGLEARSAAARGHYGTIIVISPSLLTDPMKVPGAFWP